MNVPPLITYPARPIQGGRLELAPPKRGLWYAVFAGDTTRSVPVNAVCLAANLRVADHVDALAFYQRLREANRGLGCDFFEGVVMKRAESIYPVQVRSATEEFRGWCKHRFVA